MANINSQWKRGIAIGCSHGSLADPKALATILKIVADYKPHKRVHLGDAVDMTAFRNGAKGTKDETISIKDDLAAGLNFLELFNPTDFLNGNHCNRLWKLADHPNQIISQAARSVITELCDLFRKHNTRHIDHYVMRKSFIKYGDTTFCHGWMYNVSAIRDHAEHFGKVVLAHLHRVGEESGRRIDSPVGYCVGFLGDIEKFSYADERRATAQWSQGFAQFEYNEKECRVWVRRLDSLHREP